MTRKILHLDLDAFYCAVEEQYDSALRGKPFAVGGKPDERGVVASCSYAARRYGIRSAMPMARAVRLCPELIILPARHGVYGETSRRVMDILREMTPLVEQISIDEAFLDMSGQPESLLALARRVQSRINGELSLPCSLGGATNKLVAKIANNVGKASTKTEGPPNAIRIVPPGQEAEFLAPLPTRELWGVGPKTAERLAKMGVRTIGDIARWPEADLKRRFGKHGEELARRARGIDDSPVVTEHAIKSVSRETTFARDVRDGDALRETLRKLVEGVGRQLRHSGLMGRTVTLKMRRADFTTVTRQVTLGYPTDQDRVIGQAALELFAKTWGEGRPVRLLGVGVSGFEEGARQLGLWDQPVEEVQRLQSTVDELRDRFGEKAIRRASDLKREDSDNT